MLGAQKEGEVVSFFGSRRTKQKTSGNIEVYRNGGKIGEDEKISLAMNDYISNTYSMYLPEPLYSYPSTTAEYLIKFLNNHIGEKLNFENCSNF